VARGFLERTNFNAEGCGGSIGRLRFFDFGDERGADHGSIYKSAKYGNMAGQRNAEPDGDRKLRSSASPPQESGQIVGQRIFCPSDAGSGNEIEKTRGTSRDLSKAFIGGSWRTKKDRILRA
jgi:hypothetical protein